MKRSIGNAAFGMLSLTALAMMASPAGAQSMAADRAFVMKTSQANMAEVQSGMLAQKMGASSDVRTLGKHFADNHRANEQKLMLLAKKMHVMLPMQPAPADAMAMMKLKTMSGSSFDSAYVAMEEKGHIKNIAAFKRELATTSNPMLKAYAADSLPVLEEHLQMATEDAGKPHAMGSMTGSGAMNGSGAMGSSGAMNGNDAMGAKPMGTGPVSGGIDRTPASTGAGGGVMASPAPGATGAMKSVSPVSGGQPGTPGSTGAGGSTPTH